MVDSGLQLQPGDDRQLLAMLRAGESDLDKAVTVAESFLKYQQYCKGGERCAACVLSYYFILLSATFQ